MYGRWDAGMIVHRHGHYSHQVVYVLGGGMWDRDRWCPAGTHIDLPFGAALGRSWLAQRAWSCSR